jgi:hypothetical protein
MKRIKTSKTQFLKTLLYSTFVGLHINSKMGLIAFYHVSNITVTSVRPFLSKLDILGIP